MAIIDFWEGCSVDIDLMHLRGNSITVKGKRFKDPCRFLEIFGNTKPDTSSVMKNDANNHDIRHYIPKSPYTSCPIGSGIYQPPFVWEDCTPLALAFNFTYNTNALFRIFSNLADIGKIERKDINALIDKACIRLSEIYKSHNSFILRYINNNINMYILSKVVEDLLGCEVYDSSLQEPDLTSMTLDVTLKNIAPYVSLTTKQIMACALGRGIAFLENNISIGTSDKLSTHKVEDNTFRYFEGKFAIDHRELLINRIREAQSNNKIIRMCAILDDTSESVLDLLWMQSLAIEFNMFHIHLLLNRAQISINFSSKMLSIVQQSPSFAPLRNLLGRQIFKHSTYCPLISFQSNFLSKDAWKVINECDFAFVKGLNFFETCQNLQKDTFYSFVVYGPISCLYTGLLDYDPVFVCVPKGATGYLHNKDHSQIRRLTDLNNNPIINSKE